MPAIMVMIRPPRTAVCRSFTVYLRLTSARTILCAGSDVYAHLEKFDAGQPPGEAAWLALRSEGIAIDMPSSTAYAFADPDAFHAAIRAERVEVVVTTRGEFHAELTLVDFDRLLMQRVVERLPRVLNVATHSKRAAIMFATDQSQPTIHVNGTALSRGEILVWDSGLAGHHRSAAACQWGTMSLPQQDLAAAGYAIIGRELTPLSLPRRLIPPASVLSRLLNLHEAAEHLAKTAPDILAKPEVARAIEQGLVEAMVLCFASGNPGHERSAYRQHARVMRRLEDVLQGNPEGPLHGTELCTAIGVSYRTLQTCCQEHLA